MPDNIKAAVPCVTSAPFVPAITPESVPLAPWLIVRVLLPKFTPPVPDSVLITAPLVVLLISNVAVSVTELELDMEPLPERAKMPELIVVDPL